MKAKLLSHVRLLGTPWTAAYQAPPSMGFFQARVLEWGAMARRINYGIKYWWYGEIVPKIDLIPSSPHLYKFTLGLFTGSSLEIC